jgi:hypothetical protein
MSILARPSIIKAKLSNKLKIPVNFSNDFHTVKEMILLQSAVLPEPTSPDRRFK